MPQPRELPDRAGTDNLYAFSVSDPYRFIYVRTAKVATQSISKALRDRKELEVKRVGKLRPYPKGPRRHYYAFAFVRNPYARLVSSWKDKVVGPGTWSLPQIKDIGFEDFVSVLEDLDLAATDRHIRPQHRLIPTERLSFLGRLERLDRDWEELCDGLGVGDLPLEHTHKSPDPEAAQTPRIDEHLADRIYRMYAMDFRLFGYPTEVPESLR